MEFVQNDRVIGSVAGNLERNMKPLNVLVTLLVLLSFNLVFPRGQTEAEAELPAVQQLKAVIVGVYQTGYAIQSAAADLQHL